VASPARARPEAMRPLLLALGILSLPAAPLRGEAPRAEAPQAENVLVLVVDDMGIDKTGVYGALGTDGAPLAPRTPNIDRLARRGILFRNAWTAPACSTCRAEALTGRYPNRTGIGNRIPFDDISAVGMRADELTLLDLLPPRYASGVIGKWHLAGNGGLGTPTSGIDHAPRCGFDFHVGSFGNLGQAAIDYFDWEQVRSFAWDLPASQEIPLADDYATTRTTDDALRAIRAFGERPFFLWVAYNAPHDPYHVPPLELVASDDLDLGTQLGQGKAMMEALDHEIGRLLAGVDPDVLARTTVVYFSDNGTHKNLVEPPWDPNKVKGSVYNGGVSVPFLVMSPRIPLEHRGAQCERLIDVADLLPTMGELLGFPVPAGLDGVSFLPYLSDPRAPARRPWVFTERFRPNYVPQAGSTISSADLDLHDQAVRDERYKLLRKRRYDHLGQLTSEELEFYDVELDWFETQDLLDAQGQPPAELQGVFDALLGVLDQMAS